MQCARIVARFSRPFLRFLHSENKQFLPFRVIGVRTSRVSCKNAYASSAAFLSCFFSCSRCSAAVKNVNPLLAPSEGRAFGAEGAFVRVAVDLPLRDRFTLSSSESSAEKSIPDEAAERRDDAEREEDDLTD